MTLDFSDFRCPICGRAGSLGDHCSDHALYYAEPESIAQAPAVNHLGRLIADRYVILGMLGKGGMATVYWCLDNQTQRRVAIKVMHSDDIDDVAVARERFVREGLAMTEITNPRVVKCLDFGTHEELNYMVMEFLEGTTLNTFIAHRTSDFAEIACIGSQILEGIAAVHGSGLVHRDIKPGNIMLCESESGHGFIKIIDFGLARAVNESRRRVTQMGGVLGTARYMSPEHLQGSYSVGPPTDIYAFGVILFELLSGRSPFDGPTPLEMLRDHLTKPIPTVVPLPHVELQGGIEGFLYRCLAKDPLARYPDGQSALNAWWMLELEDEGPIDLKHGWVAPAPQLPESMASIDVSLAEFLSTGSIEISFDE